MKERFIQNYSASVAIAGFSDLVQIIVPSKAVMTVLDFGNYIDTAAAWGTVYWDFFLDDLPMYPYQHIMDQIGFGTGRQTVQAVEIHGGHRFRIRATNPTAGIVKMGISLAYDMKYPEELEEENAL